MFASPLAHNQLAFEAGRARIQILNWLVFGPTQASSDNFAIPQALGLHIRLLKLEGIFLMVSISPFAIRGIS